jgi:CRISPR-associated endonuclease Cas1
MDRGNSLEFETDDLNWRERCEYWQAQKPKRHPAKKFQFREPLILCGHGIHIRVEQNTLLVRDGFTHYPQKAAKFRFFPGDANLPDRIIILDGSGGLTLDALNWMSEQQIEFVRLDWRGQVINVGGNSGYAGRSELMALQRGIKSDNRRRLKIARWLISEKIAASRRTLKSTFPASEACQKAIAQIDTQSRKLEMPLAALTMSKLFGIEGAVANAYFKVWPGLPIKWKGLSKRPIPDNWAETISRTMAWRKRSRQARHPVNAMLNYGYGIVACQLRTQIVAAGLDPTVGVIHERKDNPTPLVYDLLEPIRPAVDRAVLEFTMAHTFEPADFTINKWGGCRLNPQVARAILQQAVKIDASQLLPAFRSYLLK